LLTRIILIGAGRRVVEDILPALVANGISQFEIIILRKKHRVLEDFKNIKIITSCSDLENEIFSEKVILISSIPQLETVSAIENVLKFVSPNLVLIDTPVSAIAPQVGQLASTNDFSLKVLEDGSLIPWLGMLNSELSPRPRFYLSYRAFYLYHGMASFRKILSRQPLKVLSILNGRIIYTYRSNKSILQIGHKDYSRGRFFWIQNRRIFYLGTKLRWQRILKRTNLRELISTETFLTIISSTQKMNLDSEVLFDNPIKYMLIWKRIGLYEGFKNLLDLDINEFSNLEVAVKNEIACNGNLGFRTNI
jgi:hypothetical protein